MAKRFSGHVILVTGGSSGIGFATCRKLLAEGAKVMVHGLTLAEARDAVKRLGRGAKAVGGDLGNPKTCARIVTATVRAFGRIDGLANNAGIYPRHSIEQADEEVFDRLFHINTRAPLLCAKAAIEAFRAQKSPGSIVTIGSINGWMGLSELVVYSMSKGALPATAMPGKLPLVTLACATVEVDTVASIWPWLSARNTSAWVW